MALDPARAAVRSAVRRALPDDPGVTVLVACSGGADSLALLAATVFEARTVPLRVVGVVVDHGLQDGSAPHTEAVVARMAALGADETASIRVTVDPGPGGIEAGAREARYAALSQLAAHFGAEAVLLGHTLDDQAETVLLGLTRGSGGRSLRGMRRSFHEDGALFVRPLLDLTRAQTAAACRADGLEWWDDPHNDDPRFTRSRIRHAVMPVLERELGPGVAGALARTADLLREEAEVVDAAVGRALERWYDGTSVDAAGLAGSEPVAVRTGVLREAAIRAGAIPSELTRAHVLSLLDLRAGKEIQLPGHLTGYREGARLRFRRTESLL